MTIAVGWCESPFGLWRIEATREGVRKIVRVSDGTTRSLPGPSQDAGSPGHEAAGQAHRTAEPPHTPGDPASEAVERLRSQLAMYFAGDLHVFEVPLDLSELGDFARRLTETLASVPYGTTVTYAQLAAMSGAPRAARAVGGFCKRNPLPIVVPCHRVVRSDGTLGGYALGVDLKRRLLRLEGVDFDANTLPGRRCAR
ncbi:MAG: hypothetical protein KatS3mg008_1761 [Acidimicrobiales bacterium]|nr:MAG: hypothetical protein KatS3mg008_1761 [Acidimicrobiales bacterium]